MTEYYIDITSEVCPLTFVKTKLMIEKMPAGSRGEVLLKGSEPLKNVPRSIIEHGHKVISLEVEPDSDPENGIFRLVFQK